MNRVSNDIRLFVINKTCYSRTYLNTLTLNTVGELTIYYLLVIVIFKMGKKYFGDIIWLYGHLYWSNDTQAKVETYSTRDGNYYGWTALLEQKGVLPIKIQKGGSWRGDDHLLQPAPARIQPHAGLSHTTFLLSLSFSWLSFRSHSYRIIFPSTSQANKVPYYHIPLPREYQCQKL